MKFGLVLQFPRFFECFLWIFTVFLFLNQCFHILQTLGQHDHDNLGKLAILLATMYGFFLIQLIVSLFHKEHDHSKVLLKLILVIYNLNYIFQIRRSFLKTSFILSISQYGTVKKTFPEICAS